MTCFISKQDQPSVYIAISDEQKEFFEWLKSNGYLADDVDLNEIDPIYLC